MDFTMTELVTYQKLTTVPAAIMIGIEKVIGPDRLAAHATETGKRSQDAGKPCW